jgi:hypothetical protein
MCGAWRRPLFSTHSCNTPVSREAYIDTDMSGTISALFSGLAWLADRQTAAPRIGVRGDKVAKLVPWDVERQTWRAALPCHVPPASAGPVVQTKPIPGQFQVGGWKCQVSKPDRHPPSLSQPAPNKATWANRRAPGLSRPGTQEPFLYKRSQLAVVGSQ